MKISSLVRTGCIAAALMLAGCGEKAEQQVPNGLSEPNLVTNYQQAVLDLPERQRDGVLFRAIRDAGISCQNVVSSERVPDVETGPTWRAKCDDGLSHIVSVQSNGIGIVVSAQQR